jgi:hypothetical protein
MLFIAGRLFRFGAVANVFKIPEEEDSKANTMHNLQVTFAHLQRYVVAVV